MQAAWIAAVCLLVLACGNTEGSAPQVTCGSTIKLEHQATKALLHSHEIAYGSGSGQQSVTGSHTPDDANSFWIVRGPEAEPCVQGTPIKSGQLVRLQHAATRKWLHSHLFASPLTNNQEVSAHGDDGRTDTGDVWIIDWDKGAGAWMRDQPVRFRHTDTSKYLASHDRKFGRPIAGQQEVCAKAAAAKDSYWLATEGVYYPDQTADL
ncbi:hypothetical protein WJX72_002347 [[Myrmecia] bisecta]|uniref:MIR domain-containing protein n=1 Tax=[Myrmecia] bisecta TaxID=41462 RepID=A0AAW1PLA1_9CHLO